METKKKKPGGYFQSTFFKNPAIKALVVLFEGKPKYKRTYFQQTYGGMPKLFVGYLWHNIQIELEDTQGTIQLRNAHTHEILLPYNVTLAVEKSVLFKLMKEHDDMIEADLEKQPSIGVREN